MSTTVSDLSHLYWEYLRALVLSVFLCTAGMCHSLLNNDKHQVERRLFDAKQILNKVFSKYTQAFKMLPIHSFGCFRLTIQGLYLEF